MSQRIVIAMLLAVLVSGCQKKAEGQTVAVVNNDEITASETPEGRKTAAAAAARDTRKQRRGERRSRGRG